MNHPAIKVLVDLERTAANQWWVAEDRTAWRDGVIRHSEQQQSISLKSCLNSSTTDVPITTWDPDIARCFATRESSSTNTNFSDLTRMLRTLEKNNIFAVFPRPGFWLCDSWIEEEDDLREALFQARRVQALVIRCGFSCEQTDVLMAADLGFGGIQLHAGDLDIYQLQLLVELARDCHLCPMISIENEQQLTVALQTDAPHLIFCCLPGEGYENSIRFLNQALPRVPASCTKIALTAIKQLHTSDHFKHLGFHTILHFS